MPVAPQHALRGAGARELHQAPIDPLEQIPLEERVVEQGVPAAVEIRLGLFVGDAQQVRLPTGHRGRAPAVEPTVSGPVID